jgi:hypothetical protein
MDREELSAALSRLGDGDIEALVFIVLMEAARDMDADLKSIMEEIKAITAAKRALRELIQRVRCDLDANAGAKPAARLKFAKSGLGSEAAYHKAQLPSPDASCDGDVRPVATDLHPGPITEVDQLRAILESLRDKLDSMSEISEMTSLRLQMMMDRRSKFLSTLSNIMKKISSTQDAIIQNLK